MSDQFHWIDEGVGGGGVMTGTWALHFYFNIFNKTVKIKKKIHSSVYMYLCGVYMYV